MSGLPAPGTNNVAKPSGAFGGLKVLDWAGFAGAISFSFDDANSSQVSNYSALNALGVHYTFYLIGNKVAAQPAAWAQAVKDGHELGNHTQNHDPTNHLTQTDVDQGQQTIESMFGVKIYTMASPNGNTGYDAFAEHDNYLVNRGASGDGSMLPGNDSTFRTDGAFNLFSFIPGAGSTVQNGTSNPAGFDNEASMAVSTGGWRVVVVHGFNGGTDQAFQPVDLGAFTEGVMFAKSLPTLWIDTVVNVGSYWRGQVAFNKATVSGPTAGPQTWKWTLPTNFPPNKFLRVTVTGGTLTQNGQAVAWNSHGYYEISLDEGSLTLSP